MIGRHVICQKFQNFVNEMHNLLVSPIKHSLPNLHKSSINCIELRKFNAFSQKDCQDSNICHTMKDCAILACRVENYDVCIWI